MVCSNCTRCRDCRPGVTRLPQCGAPRQGGVRGIPLAETVVGPGPRPPPGSPPRAAAAAPWPNPRPVLASTVTTPFASTDVLPPGSGNDPWRNHAGDPFSAGPLVAGFDCVNAVWVVTNAASAATATPAKIRTRSRILMGARGCPRTTAHG